MQGCEDLNLEEVRAWLLSHHEGVQVQVSQPPRHHRYSQQSVYKDASFGSETHTVDLPPVFRLGEGSGEFIIAISTPAS